MFMLCVIAGLMVGLSLGWAVKVNQNLCPLYAHISVANINQSLYVRQVRAPN